MRLQYNNLKKKPRIFRKLTGLTLSEFDLLIKKISINMNKYFRHRGIACRIKTHENRILLLLIYYRTYAIHGFIGYFHDLNDSNVARLFYRLTPLVG